MFGNLAQSNSNSLANAPPLGGLSSPEPSRGLFGSLSPSTSQPQQPQGNTGGLFGNLGTSTSQPQQQQSNAGGMFSNLGPLPPAPDPSKLRGLFAHLETSPPQQQQSTSGGVFGSLGASQAQQQPSTTGGLFGGSLLGTTQPQNSSLFASSRPQNGQPGQAQQDNQQIESTAGGSQPAYFDSLLERGRKRTNGVSDSSGFGELPSLQLGLGDIARKVREMGGIGATAQSRKGTDSKA